MSLRLKRAARALRARYGVAEGVRPAESYQTCRAVVITHFGSTTGFKSCGVRAHVVEGDLPICKPHMKQLHAPRRR